MNIIAIKALWTGELSRPCMLVGLATLDPPLGGLRRHLLGFWCSVAGSARRTGTRAADRRGKTAGDRRTHLTRKAG